MNPATLGEIDERRLLVTSISAPKADARSDQ